jgi:PTS system ascorbate-specific IIA component
MTNKILLLTHGSVGHAMLEALENTLQKAVEDISAISVSPNLDPEKLQSEIGALATSESQNNLLILTDLFGSTPCNIATKFFKKQKVAIVSGVNFGMLIKSVNYLHLPFDQLVDKACQGGKEAIKTCECE